MLNSKTAWEVLTKGATKGQWLSLDQIYGIVEGGARLDDSDRAGISEKSKSPKWKRTVRNVLQRKKSLGEIEWDGSGRFRFKPG
jgi:hypothetical protein